MVMQRLPTTNRLLAALPMKDRRCLVGNSEQVELPLSKVLFEPEQRIEYVYFPLNGFISMLIPLEGRASLEVGLVGNEGMLGVPVALGINVSPLRALVLGSGTALRIRAPAFRRQLQASGALRRSMNRYIHVLLAQLARWLLMTHDRAQSDEFHLTHELLAQMLGVRRVGVTNSAGLLQRRKLLSYSRGTITVLDRKGLEAASCFCYETAKTTYEKALRPPRKLIS